MDFGHGVYTGNLRYMDLVVTDAHRAPDWPYIRTVSDIEGQFVEHAISGEVYQGEGMLVQDVDGFACLVLGDVTERCSHHLSSFVANKDGVLVLVRANDQGDHTPLHELLSKYMVWYEEWVFQESLHTVKTYVLEVERRAMALFWDASDMWSLLSLKLQYSRGGQSSCRHLVDRCPQWEEFALQLQLSREMFQKGRTTTRGVSSMMNDGFLPSRALATAAMLSTLVYLSVCMRTASHKEAAATFVQAFLSRFVSGRWGMRLHVEDLVEISYEKKSVKGSGQPFILPLEGTAYECEPLLVAFPSLRVHVSISTDGRGSLADLLVTLGKKDIDYFSLLSQMIFWLAMLVESSYENCRKGHDSAVSTSSEHSKGKKRDPHVLEAVVTCSGGSGEWEQESALSRKASLAERQIHVDTAKHRASLPEGVERDFMRKECYRYRQACKRVAQTSKDLSVALLETIPSRNAMLLR